MQVSRLPVAMSRRVDLDIPVSSQAIRDLRDRIELLEEENRQLVLAARPLVLFPEVWKLTSQEARVLSALLRSSSGYMAKESLLTAVYGTEADVDIKIIDVWVCKLRRKLAANCPAVRILTAWGQGFGLSADSRALLKALVPVQKTEEETRADAISRTIAELKQQAADLTTEVGQLREAKEAQVKLQREVSFLKAELARSSAVAGSSVSSLAYRWKLPRRSVELLSCLLNEDGFVSRRSLAETASTRKGPYSDGYLSVAMHHLRKQVAAFGVEIEAVYGRGYRLSDESRALVRTAMGDIERSDSEAA